MSIEADPRPVEGDTKENSQHLPEACRKVIERDAEALHGLFARMPALSTALETYRGAPLLSGQSVTKIADIIEDSAPQSSSTERGLAQTYTLGVPGNEYPGAKKDREKANKPGS